LSWQCSSRTSPQLFFTILSRASALASDRTNRDRSSAKARWLKFVAVYGGEHPLVAQTQSHMATVYAQQGKHEKAREICNLVKETNGDDFQGTVAATQADMAMEYMKQGKYEQALEAYSKLLHNQVKVLGSVHRRVAKTHVTVGLLHEQLGDFEKALVHQENAEEMYIAVSGADSQLVAENKHHIARLVQKRRDKSKEAKQFYHECEGNLC